MWKAGSTRNRMQNENPEMRGKGRIFSRADRRLLCEGRSASKHIYSHVSSLRRLAIVEDLGRDIEWRAVIHTRDMCLVVAYVQAQAKIRHLKSRDRNGKTVSAIMQ